MDVLLFLGQALAILLVAWIFRKFGPYIGLLSVIGEMAGGFLLGPTFLGFLAPDIFTAVFPKDNLYLLNTVALWVVCAYIFIIGLEFNPQHIIGKRQALIITALASAIIPACAGYLIAGYLHQAMNVTVNIDAFQLFMAVCFSVTAFPVLLCIMDEKGIKGPVRNFSIGVSSILELIAWCSLPIVLAVAKTNTSGQAGKTIMFACLFLLLWFFGIRYLLEAVWKKIKPDHWLNWFLMLVVGGVSAYVADKIGIHMMIGALVGGMVIPRRISFNFERKIEKPIKFLLPLFFASAGLKTFIDFKSGGTVIMLVIGLIFLAYSVKFFSAVFGARFLAHFQWYESFEIGHLMGSKGAMELTFIGIGLSEGMLDERFYSILALVTLANTAMSAWGVSYQRWIHKSIKKYKK